MVPPFETDTWPVCRPMLEWLLRHLPVGGTGYARPEWPEASREQLLNDFVASPFGVVDGLDRDQARELADPLVWFGCDFGPGDPLRWSPVSVEIMLADWYPRKVFGVPAGQLRRLPDVLKGFVRFSHGRKHIAAELTDDTLAAVERWSDEFMAAIARPGRSPSANAVRLALTKPTTTSTMCFTIALTAATMTMTMTTSTDRSRLRQGTRAAPLEGVHPEGPRPSNRRVGVVHQKPRQDGGQGGGAVRHRLAVDPAFDQRQEALRTRQLMSDWRRDHP
jgi:hypothetical protein